MEAVSDVYTIPQEHLDFCATIGQIARERIAPRSAEIDERAEYPWDVRKLLAEQDILGLPFPTEYGGTGTGTLMLNMAVEEIAKVDAACALILMVQELGTLPIQLFGSDELKERFLPRCATGEWSPAFALSEPEAGSDPAGMKTTAVQDGEEWVINGTKNWISNLGIADFYVTLRGHRPRDAAADRVRRRGRPAGLQRRQARAQARHPRLADRPADLRGRARAGGERDRRGRQGAVGRAGHARAHAPRRRRAGRRASPRARPTTRSPTRASAASSARRSTSSRESSSSSPTWKHSTAAARELLYKACAMADQGHPLSAKYSSMAKVFCSDTAMAVTVEAVQVLGGYGYVKEYPVERMMRDAKITQIYEGTNEIQRLVIGRTLK